MKFPAAIAQMRGTGAINAALLHYLDFKDQPKRVWQGFGPLITNDGLEWSGLGETVSVEGGGQQSGAVASNLTLTLAGGSDLITDDLTKAALDSENQVYGRRYYMAAQFFSDAWQPVDTYFYIYVGIMDRMEFKRNAERREIKLNVESPFVRRRTPRVMLFSDADQKRRLATDKAFEFMSSLQFKTVTWPKF